MNAGRATTRILISGLAFCLVAQTPVPTKEAQSKARKLVLEVYPVNKDATPEDKAQLSQKMLQAAIETKNDDTNKYVLLDMAIDLAAQAGDTATVFQALDELKGYQLDLLKTKAEVVAKIKADATDKVNEVLEEAIAADRYDVAKTLTEQLVSNARKMKDADAVKAATAKQQDILRIEEGHLLAKASIKKLAENPNDVPANLSVGRFYCFVKGDWTKGLPFLASGNDSVEKTLATKETQNPEEAAKQVELADGWWDLAEKSQGINKRKLREHAAEWYKKALPNLTGLDKAKVEKRLEEPDPVVSDMITIAKMTISAKEVKSPPVGLTNVSTNGTYTTSSQNEEPLSPSLLQTSMPEERYAFHTRAEAQPYVIITLRRLAQVRAFRVKCRADNALALERARTMAVWVSTDAKRWKEVWAAKEDKGKPSWTVMLNQPIGARYVKVGLKGTDYLHLVRVEIFGAE